MVRADRLERLADALVRRLVRGTLTEGEAMIVLESVVLGVMLTFRPPPAPAAPLLAAMNASVVARLAKP